MSYLANRRMSRRFLTGSSFRPYNRYGLHTVRQRDQPAVIMLALFLTFIDLYLKYR